MKQQTPIVAALLLLLSVLLLEFNFVHLSPIVGGYACKTNEFPFAVSLQLPNGTITQPLPHHQHYGSTANVSTSANLVEESTVTVPKMTHFCGGTYLQNGWILTASHCVFHLDAKTSGMIAVIGEINLQQRLRQVNYEVIDIVRKKFNPYTYVDDIALVRVNTIVHGEPVEEKLQVRIPTEPLAKNSESDKKDNCFLCGYGSSEYNGEPLNKLMMGPNARISQHDCEYKLGRYMAPEIGSTMFCAEGSGPNGQVDACQGDSGGALLCKNNDKYEPVGIVSYGAGCGAINSPGVYTSTADHAEWIHTIINQE